ncbi:flavin reductase family protein [Nonomuraea sp. NPDC050786]|uniref:flavin reductase family protein n=1 Tax=Nonomuraea sp. NPDC050786 TaxID=3154840 RepID=UPI0033F6EAF1
MNPEIAAALRGAARRFATGVTVMAAEGAFGRHAMTANSFVTLSLRPALIGVALTRGGRMRALVEQAGAFGVSVLGADQEHYARHYAEHTRSGEAPLVELTLTGQPPRVPVVPGCLAVFACRLWSILPVGDHELVVGEVAHCLTHDEHRPPLLFLGGRLVLGEPALLTAS